jgi:hypothetical protein
MERTATIRFTGQEPVTVPKTRAGHNLEMTYDTDRVNLAKRLRNPRFAPPVDPRTGIAEHW